MKSPILAGGTLFCLTSLLSVLGCGSALRVTQGPSKVAGVPFYTKEAKCLHQEVLAMPYYRLTLQKMEGGKVTGSQTATVPEMYYLTDPIATQFTSLIDGTADTSTQTAEEQQGTLSQDWSTIKQHGAQDVYAKISDDTWPKYLISNSSSPKVYVNYGNPYYLNTKNPLAGSAKADYKLASDGTLTEASGEVSEETLKTVLGALPVSNLIQSAEGIGVTSKSVGETSLQLKAELRILKITKFQTVPFEPGCPDTDAFQQTPAVGTLIEDVGSDSPTQSKSEDNSITVTGKILLPKASATGAPSDAKQQPNAKENTNPTPK